MADSTQTMNAFGSMFSEENKATKKAEETYKAEVAAANGSPSKIQEATRKYQRELSKIADSTLAKDRKLALTLPFELTAELKKQIAENIAYYEHEKVLTRIDFPATCVECGKKQNANEIVVHDVRSNVHVCLNCAQDGMVIDGIGYRLEVY